MTIRVRGPVLATIIGFSAIILMIAGLMIGWKWIAPATEEEAVVTSAVVAEHLISDVESIDGLKAYSLEYFKSINGPEYDLRVHFNDESVSFYDRPSIEALREELPKLEAFK